MQFGPAMTAIVCLHAGIPAKYQKPKMLNQTDLDQTLSLQMKPSNSIRYDVQSCTSPTETNTLPCAGAVRASTTHSPTHTSSLHMPRGALFSSYARPTTTRLV